jgi:predicted glycoside hydrolase/deacetylase ChbG (UPF0249 family)
MERQNAMTTRLIVNADDYGRSANISRGIREAHIRGIVTSTTCMMNMPTVMEDIGAALRETPGLGLGVHLLLTAGRPLLPAERVGSLTLPDGMFLKLEQLIARRGELDAGEARSEWQAQIEKFIAAAGRRPTHLDSHHHSTYFTPGLFQSMLELAKEYDLPIRLPVAQGAGSTLLGLPDELVEPMFERAPQLLQQFDVRHPDAFFASFYDLSATKEEFLRIVDGLGDGVFEVMTHPGYSDADLAASSGYAVQRERELAILTDAEVIAEIRKRNIELVSFAQI